MVSYRDEYGGGWQHPLIGKQDKTPVDMLDALGQDRFIIGSPQECIETIERFHQAFGVDHLICRLYFPGMPHEQIMQEIQLLAKEVVPHFRK
jgi:alkanesulfonate monooxygenase SsuD/methylene tetrahydromethanopterin reductase-like flavin-dependent oxidoreductase (luciferase family)